MDHFKLLRNAVDWATNEEPPVTVTGPGVLDVTVWRAKKLVHRSSRESHEPDVDERPGARVDSDWRAKSPRAIARWSEHEKGSFAGCGKNAAC